MSASLICDRVLCAELLILFVCHYTVVAEKCTAVYLWGFINTDNMVNWKCDFRKCGCDDSPSTLRKQSVQIVVNKEHQTELRC